MKNRGIWVFYHWKFLHINARHETRHGLIISNALNELEFRHPIVLKLLTAICENG